MITALLEKRDLINNTLEKMEKILKEASTRLGIEDVKVELAPSDDITVSYIVSNGGYEAIEVISPDSEGDFTLLGVSLNLPVTITNELERIATKELKPIIYRMIKNWLSEDLEKAKQVDRALDILLEDMIQIEGVNEIYLNKNNIEFGKDKTKLHYWVEKNPMGGYKFESNEPLNVTETMENCIVEFTDNMVGI